MHEAFSSLLGPGFFGVVPGGRGGEISSHPGRRDSWHPPQVRGLLEAGKVVLPGWPDVR